MNYDTYLGAYARAIAKGDTERAGTLALYLGLVK